MQVGLLAASWHQASMVLWIKLFSMSEPENRQKPPQAIGCCKTFPVPFIIHLQAQLLLDFQYANLHIVQYNECNQLASKTSQYHNLSADPDKSDQTMG